MYKFFFKRFFDFIFGFLGILLISPLLVTLFILLFFANKGKVFFRQQRPGKNERIFSIIKFKTMTDEKDAEGKLLPDVKRMTKIGSFVRKYSLDEIPQLFSVVKGDMSLIGPRPLLVKYLNRYSSVQKRRHEVRPGITGWAQVNGRNSIDWEQKFKLDVYYVDNISASLDLKILYLTFLKVVKSDGINSGTNDTMPEFKGSIGKEA